MKLRGVTGAAASTATLLAIFVLGGCAYPNYGYYSVPCGSASAGGPPGAATNGAQQAKPGAVAPGSAAAAGSAGQCIVAMPAYAGAAWPNVPPYAGPYTGAYGIPYAYGADAPYGDLYGYGDGLDYGYPLWGAGWGGGWGWGGYGGRFGRGWGGHGGFGFHGAGGFHGGGGGGGHGR